MAKITYGLTNLYYSKITEGVGGAITYATPVRINGAVSLSLDAEGDTVTIYADNIKYVTAPVNGGYSGDLTVYNLPDSFYTDILGMQVDENGVYVEGNDDVQHPFALLGEFWTEGEEKKRFVLYNCSAARPSFGGQTKEDSLEAQEYQLSISCGGAADTGKIKATVTNASATATQYNGWFTSVYVPDFEA